jgi:hypothetical protein
VTRPAQNDITQRWIITADVATPPLQSNAGPCTIVGRVEGNLRQVGCVDPNCKEVQTTIRRRRPCDATDSDRPDFRCNGTALSAGLQQAFNVAGADVWPGVDFWRISDRAPAGKPTVPRLRLHLDNPPFARTTQSSARANSSRSKLVFRWRFASRHALVQIIPFSLNALHGPRQPEPPSPRVRAIRRPTS